MAFSRGCRACIARIDLVCLIVSGIMQARMTTVSVTMDRPQAQPLSGLKTWLYIAWNWTTIHETAVYSGLRTESRNPTVMLLERWSREPARRHDSNCGVPGLRCLGTVACAPTDARPGAYAQEH